MKPFLVLQLRPETEASDNEFDAILDKGGLRASDTVRMRLDQARLASNIDLDAFSGVIVGGGPGCVSDADDEKPAIERRIEQDVLNLMPEITARDIPFMGCCYGIGILGHHLGARVSKERYSEPVGPSDCVITEAGRADPLLSGLSQQFTAFVGHKEALQELPEGCVHLLSSEACPYQMIRYKENVYATQFHPEADGEVFEVRINIYRDKGYFPPEDADRLIAQCHAESVTEPERILRAFVGRYWQS
ncbi:MAG: glutamine amidotransferase [Pseudomonadota bacterium]